MKAVISAILVFSLSFSSAFADKKSAIAQEVETLSALAMGVESHSVKGKNAEEIFKKWVSDYRDEETALVFKEIGQMSYGDEIDEGFTSTQSAIKMSGFAESFLEESLEGLDVDSESDKIKEIKAQVYDLNRKWAPTIKRLEKLGAKFGYTGFGPGYCGISFVELIVVDEKEQKLYEIYLSEGGAC